MSCAAAGLLHARSAATQKIVMFGDIRGTPHQFRRRLAGAAARSRADNIINPILSESATVKLVGVVGVGLMGWGVVLLLDATADRWGGGSALKSERSGKALKKATPALRFSEHMAAAAGEAMFRHACAMGLEGIVSKRVTSRYKSGSCIAWVSGTRNMSGEPETSPGGRRLSRNKEAGMGFKLDPREIGWAPYVMIGGGFGAALLVLAAAMFLKHS